VIQRNLLDCREEKFPKTWKEGWMRTFLGRDKNDMGQRWLCKKISQIESPLSFSWATTHQESKNCVNCSGWMKIHREEGTIEDWKWDFHPPGSETMIHMNWNAESVISAVYLESHRESHNDTVNTICYG
jgi:hypothetical protein